MDRRSKILIGVSLAVATCCILVSSGIVPTLLSFVVPPFIADCGWYDSGRAWVDLNQNGIWDHGEKPLDGVILTTIDLQYPDELSNYAITDADGRASVFISPLACGRFEQVEIVVRATPPANYRSTTAAELTIPREAILNDTDDLFTFGFVLKSP